EHARALAAVLAQLAAHAGRDGHVAAPPDDVPVFPVDDLVAHLRGARAVAVEADGDIAEALAVLPVEPDEATDRAVEEALVAAAGEAVAPVPLPVHVLVAVRVAAAALVVVHPADAA